MKKLMIAAAIVCAAVFAQASQVNWSSGVVYAPGDDGTGYKGNYSQIDPDAATYTAILTVSDSYSEGAMGAIVYTSPEVTTMDESTESYMGSIADGILSDGMHYAQLVIAKDDGSMLTSDIFKFETGSFSAVVGVLVGEGGSGIALANGNDLDEDYGAFGAGWTAAPEPTSGLLLLIGVGALALRRRRV